MIPSCRIRPVLRPGTPGQPCGRPACRCDIVSYLGVNIAYLGVNIAIGEWQMARSADRPPLVVAAHQPNLRLFGDSDSRGRYGYWLITQGYTTSLVLAHARGAFPCPG